MLSSLHYILPVEPSYKGLILLITLKQILNGLLFEFKVFFHHFVNIIPYIMFKYRWLLNRALIWILRKLTVLERVWVLWIIALVRL